MPFKKIGENKYVSDKGTKFTGKQLAKFDRSITRADKIAQKKAKAEIKSRLKAIQRKSKGKLSQSQLLAVTNRFANVNLSSEKSIDETAPVVEQVTEEVVEESPKRNAKVFDYDNLSEQPLEVLEEKLEEAEIDTQSKDQRLF